MERVNIPTNECFSEQWEKWVCGKVHRLFKRNQDRVTDVIQLVHQRYLAKDFIGRWFYKHLTDELVDRTQAELMLFGAKLAFISYIKPVEGKRSSPDSLWRVQDLLDYAKFDYDRYFYSIQNHTLDSNKVLQLLGYPKNSYNLLASLYRQGRLYPSEFTEHTCSGRDTCPKCEAGKASLSRKGLSLAQDWNLSKYAAKLRWNDSQLAPFLRNWKRSNMIAVTPAYIMRPADAKGKVKGIDAGLLKYAEIILNNVVNNEFKHMARTDDTSLSVFNNGASPVHSNSELLAYDGDGEDDQSVQIFQDTNSLALFGNFENRKDISSIIENTNLTDEERSALLAVEFMEMSVREYALTSNTTVSRVHRVRASYMKKICYDNINIEETIYEVCEKYGCKASDITDVSIVFGPCVKARTELFSRLHDKGMTIHSISNYFCFSENKIVAAINRSVNREIRNSRLST